MVTPRRGVRWLPGDVLVRYLPCGWGVPPGWTILGEDGEVGLVVWRHALEYGFGDPDVYVATPPPSAGTAVPTEEAS